MRYAFGAVLGGVAVTSIEIALFCAIIALATAIQIYATFKIVQIAASTIVGSVNRLDNAIAEAIDSVVGQGIGQFEPPNPIVSILADYVKSQLPSQTAEVQVLARDNDGKFS
tara:strand:+ start:418 stop:753 length:336 start_codon:yes stop_codon:yes gene_type:complete